DSPGDEPQPEKAGPPELQGLEPGELFARGIQAAVPQIEIIVTKDGAELLRKSVKPGEYLIGREPDCDVQINAEMVSRKHARLTINYDHALIEDLGSSNGTFVNGKRVTGCIRLWS